jgi:serine/threonine protein kinase
VEQELGPYRIVRKIAQGGMAEVFLARQHGLEGLERTVVVKRILPHYAGNDEFVTMFLDEARLLAALVHPNIAQVFDLGQTDETFYLVMEYVRGPTLGALLNAGSAGGARLPEKVALGIALGIGEALVYVHGRRDEFGRPLRIVHRDLNPANVIVSYDGAVKLIDFGIAKAKSKVYETRTGVVKGTFGYIAPEQITKRVPVDHRADVFSLGVLLYEMCVGRHPFAEGADTAHLVERMLSAGYRRPSLVVPAFPHALEELIRDCLAPYPDSRPGDVRELIDRIASYMGKRGLVVTMGDIAATVSQLLPDTEGPAPLRLATGRQKAIGEARDTRKLQRASDPPPADSDEKTIRVAPARPVDHDEVDDDDPTTADEDAATVVAGPERRRRQPSADDMTNAPTTKRPPLATDYVAPAPPRPYNPIAYALWGGAGALLMVVVATGAFLTVRSCTEPEPTDEPARDARIGPPVPPPVEDAGQAAIEIQSEPSGATVNIDGEEMGQTPLVYPVPSGRNQIWVQVTLAGYEPEARHVMATAPIARFRLAPLDAGPPP